MNIALRYDPPAKTGAGRGAGQRVPRVRPACRRKRHVLLPRRGASPRPGRDAAPSSCWKAQSSSEAVWHEHTALPPSTSRLPPFSGLRRSSEAVRHEHTWRNLAPSPRHVPRPRRFPSWDTAPHRQTSKLEVAGAEARPHERASASRRVLAFQAPAVLLCGQGNSARGFRQQLCTRGE